MNKIIVTGANGFVGSNLAKKLHNNGNEVVNLVREGSDVSLIENKNFIHYIDYNNSDELKELIKSADIFIHAAAITRARKWHNFQKINIDLTNKLLNICNETNIKHFIFLSSQAVSGPSNNINSIVTENDEPNPVTMYGKSKQLAEELIIKNSKIPFTIVRAVSVYGAGDKDFLKLFKMVNNHIVLINSFRKKYYNLIYIDELTDFIQQIVGKERAYNEILLAANPKIIENKELYKMIGDAINKKIITIRIPELFLSPIAYILELLSLLFNKDFPILNKDKVNEFRKEHWIVDTKKSSKILNIKFMDNFKANFNKTYNWYKDNGWL